MNEARRVSAFLTAFFCAAAISVGAMFCVATAFDVPVRAGALAFVLVLLSALFSLLCGLRRGWLGLSLLVVLALAAGYVYRLELYRSTSVAVETVSAYYALVYDTIETITLVENTDGATATAFFSCVGALLALVTAWSVRGQNTLVLALVLAALPLVLCLIILQSVPAAWAVLLVVGAMALLLLTQSLRVRSEAAGGRLALALLVPLALLMGLLYAAFPMAGYTRSAWSDSLAPKISAAADRLSMFRFNEATGQVQFVSPVTPSTLGARVWDNSVTRANLNRVGPQRLSGRSVMQLYADDTRMYYLRASSLGVYEDNAWRAVTSYENVQIPDDVFIRRGEDGKSTVRVKTEMKSSVFYTPYAMTQYPENAQPVYDAYVKNPLQATEYDFPLAINPENYAQKAATEDAYRDFVYDTYLQIPDALRETFDDMPELVQMKQDAASAIGSLPDWVRDDAASMLSLLGRAVLDIVGQGKRYSLDTPRVPDGEDFVTWFLRESETGYCVHFATAGTMLLRYLGVPARYVTGYLTQSQAGEWTTVTQDEAHAWIEVYLDGFGWMVLDPTPSVPSEPDDVPPDEDPPEDQPEPEQPDTPKPDDEIPENPEQPEEKPSNNTDNIDKNINNSFENVPQQTQGERGIGKVGKALLTALWALLSLTALVFVWRIAVLSARTARFTRGSTNRRAVHYYRHIAMLARLGGAEVSEQLTALAQKARFSQHKLEEAELAPLTSYAQEMTVKLLDEAKPAKRALYRLVYVLK